MTKRGRSANPAFPDKWFPGFASPNFTSVPDEVFDLLLPFLSEAELKVLLYIIRRTFGFKKSVDSISIRQMADGIKSASGEQLDHGTGLSIPSITKAVKSLERQGIVVAVRSESKERGYETTAYLLNLHQQQDPYLKFLSSPTQNFEDALLKNFKIQDTVVQETDGRKKQQQQHTAPTQPELPADGQGTVVASSISTPDDEQLMPRLMALGVSRTIAHNLLTKLDPGRVYRWLCYAEHKLQTGWVPGESPAAWLVSAIRSKDWIIPEWFQTPEEAAASSKTKARAAVADRERREQEASQERKAAEDQRRQMEDELGIGERTREIWEQAKTLLQERREMSPALFSAYLLPLKGSAATLVTPVEFFCKAIEGHSEVILQALADASGRAVTQLEVRHVAAGNSELQDEGK